MRFFKDLFVGLRAYWKAIGFIHKEKLYWFIPIPAVFMLLIYKLGDMIRSHHSSMGTENMNSIVWGMIILLLEIMIGMTLMKFSKYLVVIILSPLLSYLSQTSERILTGNTYDFDLEQLFRDIKRGIRIAMRNIMWHYFFFLILFIVAYIGWEKPEESPVFYLTFILGFFYYGFSFLDYVHERLRWDMDQSIRFVRKHRGLAISIGMIYSMLILVPVDLSVLFSSKGFEYGFIKGILNYSFQIFLWICAASAPILAIIAATIAMHDTVDLKKQSSKKLV
jgi:CysZ protein